MHDILFNAASLVRQNLQVGYIWVSRNRHALSRPRQPDYDEVPSAGTTVRTMSKKKAILKPASTGNITSVLTEKRIFKPRADFTRQAHVKSMAQYKKLYAESVSTPEKFWARIASELHWFKTWKKVLAMEASVCKMVCRMERRTFPTIAWTVISNTWRRNKAAILWEGEPGETRTLTYQQLHREVCRFANVLKSLGVQKGDRVALYMPMVPELAIAMLACARIGATHSVIFAGFSAQAIVDRVQDAQAKLIVTADGCFRRGILIELKKAVDEAVTRLPFVENVWF